MSMQFVPYIKFSFSYLTRYNIFPLTILLLSTLLLSACSSTQDQEDSIDNNESFKNIIQDITDLVEFPWGEQNEKTATSNKNKVLSSIQQVKPKPKNAYLEQETLLISEVPDDVKVTYHKALMFMDQQKWLAASALFDQVITKQPNLSGSYINQALIIAKLSKQSNGEEQLNSSELLIDKAIGINPLNPYAHYLKGIMQQDKGHFEQAEKHFNSALSIWPGYAKAQLSMAILLELYRGKMPEAYAYYTAYLKHNIDDKQVQHWRAALAIKIKRAGLSLPAQKGK